MMMRRKKGKNGSKELERVKICFQQTRKESKCFNLVGMEMTRMKKISLEQLRKATEVLVLFIHQLGCSRRSLQEVVEQAQQA